MTRKERVKIALKRELARRSFWHFCLYYDRDLFSSRPFLEEIANAMQDIEEGKIKSLSISLPPRAGKSYITTLFCAWTLGRNPSESVMRNTCTAQLYQKFSYDVRNVVKSDKFMEIFDVRLSDDKANLNGWNTDQAKMVSFFGAGVGGTIIGFGASKVAITDDLFRGMEDALSDSVNDRIHQWKQATHDSRFETGCARIDIGTRWTKDDVIGRSTERGEYDKRIVISALTEKDESFCESVMTTEEYLDKRSKMLKEIWMAEYQQTPMDLEGRLFSGLKTMTSSEFKTIHMNANASQIDGCLSYIDVADQGKDFTSMAVIAVIKGDLFVVDYLFTRDNTDVTIPLAAAMLDKWRVSYCRVESNSMGAMFSRQLQRQTKTKILQVHNTTNKITRIIMQSAFIIQEMTFVLDNGPHCTQFMENVESFSKEGKNKNDDAPDCMAGLSMFTQSMLPKLNKTKR
jgi:predicted phage terminase large subunit-like protein